MFLFLTGNIKIIISCEAVWYKKLRFWVLNITWVRIITYYLLILGPWANCPVFLTLNIFICEMVLLHYRIVRINHENVKACCLAHDIQEILVVHVFLTCNGCQWQFEVKSQTVWIRKVRIWGKWNLKKTEFLHSV